MCVPCILSAGAFKTWYQSMRTLFGRLKKKTSGQAAKQLTARQRWTKENFGFLAAHLVIRADHSQLGKVGTSAAAASIRTLLPFKYISYHRETHTGL